MLAKYKLKGKTSMSNIFKTFEWPLCLELTNQKVDLAKELLALFAQDLPLFKTQINAAYNSQDYSQLLDHIHKLHGACCYSCAPLLKNIVATIETNLKAKEYSQLDTLIKSLNEELERVLVASKEFI